MTVKPLPEKANKKPVKETFCERCGREAFGYKWCSLCHDALDTFLKWMTGHAIVCGHCRATSRPGVLIYTRERCPRCGFDLSAELAESKPKAELEDCDGAVQQ